MKIVVTDGYTLNPGDLRWDALEQLGAVTIYDRTPAEAIIDRCKDAQIVLTNKVPIAATTMEALPNLKMIGVLATGYNVIHIAAAKKCGVVVCNVPAYGTASVAQHTIALLLELTNHVGLHATSVQQGAWVNADDWCYTIKPLIELAGKTIGLVGFGHIGRQTAIIAKALGMNVLFHTPVERQHEIATWCSIDDLFRQSDVISLHCPLTATNKQFVNGDLLALMKPSAFLLNTSRGPLIHEAHLAEALATGRIAGAALDVLSTEPPLHENPLLHAPNCIITPHNAWMSREARQRIMEVTVKNVSRFIEGSPQNVVA